MEKFLPFFLDLAAVLFVLGSIRSAARRGVVRTVVQLIGVRWGVGVVIMLVVQVVLVLLVGRLAVRHWRSTRNAPQPPTA